MYDTSADKTTIHFSFFLIEIKKKKKVGKMNKRMKRFSYESGICTNLIHLFFRKLLKLFHGFYEDGFVLQHNRTRRSSLFSRKRRPKKDRRIECLLLFFSRLFSSIFLRFASLSKGVNHVVLWLCVSRLESFGGVTIRSAPAFPSSFLCVFYFFYSPCFVEILLRTNPRDFVLTCTSRHDV